MLTINIDRTGAIGFAIGRCGPIKYQIRRCEDERNLRFGTAFSQVHRTDNIDLIAPVGMVLALTDLRQRRRVDHRLRAHLLPASLDRPLVRQVEGQRRDVRVSHGVGVIGAPHLPMGMALATEMTA